MRSFTMPGSDIVAPEVTLGMMRIYDKSDAEIRDLVSAARSVGIDFFDHADVYGAWSPGGYKHLCEQRFAEALKLTPAEREEIIIQTKAGIHPLPQWFDFSYDHIISSVNGSLKALQTDYIDILLLHRPDALVEPEEVAKAFDELAASGKVRAFGVSNHTPGQIELLKTAVKQPLIANQIQYSIGHAHPVAQGVAANINNLPQSNSRDLGVVDYSRLHNITLQAWSPFQADIVKGTVIDNPELPELNVVMKRLAAEYQVPLEAIATAWILRHPALWQVVLGTTTPQRVIDSAKGADIDLTREQWYEIFRAAGHEVP